MPDRTRTHHARRAAVAAAVLLLHSGIAAACQENADGSVSVDRAYLCVRTGDGAIRWSANKDCRDGEVLVRVDTPTPPASWSGGLTHGATSPDVPTGGAARSTVLMTTKDIPFNAGASCDAVIHGATTRVTGYPRSNFDMSPVLLTVDWADPGAANGVAVTCSYASQPSAVLQASLTVTPVA